MLNREEEIKINVFEIAAKIKLDASEYKDKLSSLESSTTNVASKIGSGLASFGKVAAAGVATVASGLAALTTECVKNYAQYEQLVGGVKTLFGTEANSVQEYAKSVGKSTSEVAAEYNNLTKAQNIVFSDAKNAWKDVGMSANEYMENVTSFSASLTSSLGGDTVKSAKKAKTALVDMADNANKMGTSMDMITNAYNGFAKQNYTMLDNLKLGYGGTKSEMERLLADAQELSGVEYNIDSFGDIVDAIHVVQDEMGITGTTMKEAMETIEGSMNATKAAWENLVTGFADEDADIGQLIDDFVKSGETLVTNTVPKISQALTAVSENLPTLLSTIGTAFEEIVPQLLPSLGTALQGLFDTVFSDDTLDAVSGLSELLDDGLAYIAAHGAEAVKNVGDFALDFLEIVFSEENVKNAVQACEALIQGIVDFVVDAENWAQFGGMLQNVGGGIIDAIAGEGTYAEYESNMLSAIEGYYDDTHDEEGNALTGGAAFADELANGDFGGIFEAWQEGIGEIGDTITSPFQSAWESLSQLGENMRAEDEKLIGSWNSLKENASGTWESIRTTVSTSWENLKATASTSWEGIKTTISTTWDNVKMTTSTALENVKTAASTAWENMKSTVSTAWTNITLAISNAWVNIKTTVESKTSSIVETVTSKFSSLISSAATWGADMISNFVSGITSMWNSLVNTLNQAAATVRDFLGFSEPEKGPLSNFHTYAPDMMDLFSQGIKDNESKVTAQVASFADNIKNGLQIEAEPTVSLADNIKNGLQIEAIPQSETFVQAVRDTTQDSNKDNNENSNNNIYITNNITISSDEQQDIADELAERIQEALENLGIRQRLATGG